ncbi:acetamidase/formamidase family protein [uncultured Marinobacter sp.]|uniref:acetamidase/formamidase family protein n=1 Tax=uncultured Marinobacter sp. TaxID=187379 RepID=UPI0030D7B829
MTNHICNASCNHGITAENESDIREEFDTARRSFLKTALMGSGAVSLGAMGVTMSPMAGAATSSAGASGSGPMHYFIPATAETVLWGHFSKIAKAVVEVESGDFVTIETLTHHANDDADRMVKGDPGAESVFFWDNNRKGVDRRGAGPMDAEIGAGAGAGVHICTGPVRIKGAEPGDVLEVRIADVFPRPSGNPDFKGKTFGSNAAAWWGFHYGDMLTEPKKREVITIFEVDATGERNWAKAVYNFRWTPQKDPFGVVHSTIDYPGVPVDHSTISRNNDVLKDIRIPIRPHFGTIGVAPAEADIVDSIPPSYTGGNIDNWRIGKGAKLFFPVAVDGANFSVGDPHASQGDSELCGTAIECSLTGVFQFILHKKADLPDTPLAELNYPLLETQDDWVLHGFSYANYLAELGAGAQQEIYSQSSVDKALRDAYHKMRHFLMNTQKLSEDEAIALMSVAVDFGITQVVDGNWGVHAILKKSMFPARA